MGEEKFKAEFSIDLVLECARGLSALWVFLFHISHTFEHSSPFLYAIARYGYQGVTVFFVISGYCIYSAAEKTRGNQQHPNTFLIRRLVRVMPPFWASIILIVALPFLLEAISSVKSGSYVFPTADWMQFTIIDWLQVATLTKVFFSHSGDLQGAFSPINSVYWSLAVELQLYLVIYAALLFKSSWKKLLIAVLIIAVPVSTITALNQSGLFFPFWPAFFFGIALRWAHQRRITPWLAFGKYERLASCLSAGSLITAVVLFIFSPLIATTFLPKWVPNLEFIAASALAAVLLWLLGGIEHSAFLGGASIQSKGGFLSTVLLAPLCLLGQSSYSLYLLHGQLYRLPDMFIRQIYSHNDFLYASLLIFSTGALCFGFYKIIEVPFQRLARSFSHLKPPGQPIPALLNAKRV